MLFSRESHKLFLQRIPLVKSRVLYKFDATSVGMPPSIPSANQHRFEAISVGIRQGSVPTRTQILSVVITALTLPVIFIAASEAQVPQTTKSQESTAKEFVGAMNKAQQAYYAQNTGFTSSVSNLGLGIKPDTDNYSYSITTGNKAVFNYGVSQQANLKSFVGGVFLVGNTTTKTILCQTNAAGTAKPANPTNKNGVLSCGANTVKVAG